tara:strand:+ start:153 stop:893 length:741 start_codon:yes stop_codon:yes gene_type:complete
MLSSLFDVPIAFSFSAGIVAAFNPCGVAMLPAYIGYQMGSDDLNIPYAERLSRAFLMGISVTSGFVLFSLIVGLIITAGGGFVLHLIPFGGLVVGILMLSLGLTLTVTGKEIGIWSTTRVTFGHARSTKGIFLFGIAYAISSLGCAFPIFLAAIGILAGQTLGEINLIQSTLRFASYGLGMGLVLTTVTVGTILFKDTLSKFIKAIMPYVRIIGNMALIGAGAYLVWYWLSGDGSELLKRSIEKLT